MKNIPEKSGYMINYNMRCIETVKHLNSNFDFFW